MMTLADKNALIAERNRLREKLDAIEADYKRGLDPDSGERAVQLENAETLAEIQRVTAEELDRVEESLRVEYSNLG